MVLDLLNIERITFLGRTISSGALASNMLGLGDPDLEMEAIGN